MTDIVVVGGDASGHHALAYFRAWVAHGVHSLIQTFFNSV